MKTKKKIQSEPIFTHEGGKADKTNYENQLRRSVLTTMLFENDFYENGESIANRIKALIPKVPANKVYEIAVEARTKQKLRHVPLLLAREMARLDSHKFMVADTLNDVIRRADELSEFLAIYWKNGKQPLSSQVKKGLAKAFCKFDEFALGRYQDTGAVKLRDVLFLSHAKPQNKAQAKLWKNLVDGKLSCPENTWEVKISETGGEGKKEAWTKLLQNGDLKALALLKNLRNLIECGVNDDLIRKALNTCNPEWVLPFRFVSAAKYAPKFEPELEQLMFKCLSEKQVLGGRTALIVDVSGSMSMHKITAKSELNRLEASSALAMLLREICDKVDVYTFSKLAVQVAPRRGFALIDTIKNSQPNKDPKIEPVINMVNQNKYDRVIVITDGQIEDKLPAANANYSYIINVASNQNGIGYKDGWQNIDGWSENVIDYIGLAENLEQ